MAASRTHWLAMILAVIASSSPPCQFGVTSTAAAAQAKRLSQATVLAAMRASLP